MLNKELIKSQDSYPELSGIFTGIFSFKEHCQGTNLSDRIALAGINLLFPEYFKYGKNLQHLITMTHQIDHFFDVGIQENYQLNNSISIINFNDLYSDFLKANLEDNFQQTKSILGFLTHVFLIEKKARQLKIQSSSEEAKLYRELLNTVWVRMSVSFCEGQMGRETDSAGLAKVHNLN